MLPMAGEYVSNVVREGIAQYLAEEGSAEISELVLDKNTEIVAKTKKAQSYLPNPMPPRPPSFCTGCPERPIMAALKMLMKERGKFHISMDIGCNLLVHFHPSTSATQFWVMALASQVAELLVPFLTSRTLL